jgi:hypothetical protein
MRTKDELDRLRDRAIALRLEGKSRREIKAALGPIRESTINGFLRGVPPPDWTRRPNAKDELHAQARQLRLRGMNYLEIAASLGVSKSSVSLWVRDLPTPAGLSSQERRKRSVEGFHRYWATEGPAREARRAAVSASAAAGIGEMTDREILIAGAVAYWCEGTKNKPHRRADRVVFINSDAALIGFFLRFLDTADVTREALVFRVYIHETADVQAAQQFWLDVTGAHPSQFRRPALKRHNPSTVRRNVGVGYHGCLRIDVRRSSNLYRQIEGWAAAVMVPPVLSAGSA